MPNPTTKGFSEMGLERTGGRRKPRIKHSARDAGASRAVFCVPFSAVAESVVPTVDFDSPASPRAYFFVAVTSGKSSVRNGDAGRPALFWKLQTGKLLQPKRTATGLDTFSLLTTSVSPLIVAVAL